jgi:hypothetical protein
MSRSMAAALAMTLVCFTACSNEEGDTSLVSEARANPPAGKDYGWRTSPGFSSGETGEVREYY